MKAIMVMFDSLNRHMLPPYGCEWTHMPNFERLARHSVLFENNYVGSMPCMPARREIQKEGLIVDSVQRRTRMGRRVTETVIATKSRYVDLYRRHYDGWRLRDTPDDARFQGRLFGYPSCCVEAFVERPYLPNGLDPRDQAILFHWACPSCRATPGLVREYRRANSVWGYGRVPERRTEFPGKRGAGHAAKVAASLALAAGTAALAIPLDPHQWQASDDGDRDGLSVAEEMRMGTNWHLDDTDGDQVNDGQQMGQKLAQVITQPAFWLQVDEFPLMGVVDCEVCGQAVNMGYVEIHNWINGLSMQLNYIDIHALEKGCTKISFRYCPPPCGLVTHTIDLDQLKRVLMPDFITPHPIPPRLDDSDGDGLTDAEEAVLGTDPQSGADGAALAEELLAIIERLPRQAIDTGPYLLEHEMDGVEQCEACGGTFNMGMVEIVSPRDGMSVSMPYVALHMMAHGGFAYDGTTNEGEVLPLALRTVLTANGSAHWVSITGDTDDDGLTDTEEAFFGSNPAVPDEDATATPDGREVAMRMAAKISVLPEGPQLDGAYVVHHPTRGYYECLVCGELIDMGYMSVVDPAAPATVDVPYYSHHFMEKGSFSTDRDDLYLTNRLIYRGFNHPGEPPESGPEEHRLMQSAPNFNKNLNIIVRTTNGDYCSYAGIWYEPEIRIAYVEPVCTDPDYRRLGLATAAVLESIRRCGDFGATVAFVGSEKPFYLAMGFKKIYNIDRWELELA